MSSSARNPPSRLGEEQFPMLASAPNAPLHARSPTSQALFSPCPRAAQQEAEAEGRRQSPGLTQAETQQNWSIHLSLCDPGIQTLELTNPQSQQSVWPGSLKLQPTKFLSWFSPWLENVLYLKQLPLPNSLPGSRAGGNQSLFLEGKNSTEEKSGAG